MRNVVHGTLHVYIKYTNESSRDTRRPQPVVGHANTHNRPIGFLSPGPVVPETGPYPTAAS